MAETLGSLVDKITIKEIRKFHLREMLEIKNKKFPPRVINSKISLLDKQIKVMSSEIDCFVLEALKGKVALKEAKLKIYNALEAMNNIPQIASIGQSISGLARKNLELWHLEDQARRKDVKLDYIGKIKLKIDLANQQRNDWIDRIDCLFEELIDKKLKRR